MKKPGARDARQYREALTENVGAKVSEASATTQREYHETPMTDEPGYWTRRVLERQRQGTGHDVHELLTTQRGSGLWFGAKVYAAMLLDWIISVFRR